MPKLTDSQLVILSAAARRKDSTVLPVPRSYGPGRTHPATSTGCPNRAGPGRRGQPLSHRRRSQGGLTS